MSAQLESGRKGVQLEPQELDRVFPFHLVFDSQLKILQAGSTLQKQQGRPLVGSRLQSCFSLERPPVGLSFEALADHREGTVFLKAVEGELRLKGQIVIRDDALGFFLGSPWVTSLQEITDLGLSVSDFPLHSSVPDHLVLLQTQNTQLQELEHLAEGLSVKQRELKGALIKAEEASAAKSEFLASVSHELRTPLNAVLGFGSLLEGAKLDSRSQDYLRVLRQASEHLEALVADLLDLSRAERGELDVRQLNFNLRLLINQTIDVLLPQATKKGLSLRGGISESLPAWIQGDPRRIQQVLVNLLGNAVRYTDAGRVTLSVAEGSTPGTIGFCVRDTGPGIPRAKREEVFERFARCTPSGDGLGLGLAISQSLVQRMGGCIKLDSEPSQGAVFSFSLPLPPGSPGSAGYTLAPGSHAMPGDDPCAPTAGALRVLIAEDNEDNRLLLREYLRDTGCSATFAQDGIEALEMFHPGAFDLVLVDLQMPRLDGYATIRALRAVERDRSGRPMPIIAVSADAYPESIQKCLTAGASAHLAKPLRREELFEALSRHAGDIPRPPGAGVPCASPASVRALRGRYVGNQRSRLVRMREALETEDLGVIARLAHQIKGTAASFGVEALGAAAKGLEARSLAEDLLGARRALEEFACALDTAENPYMA
jgi:two-component system sensor histidine kinase TorS